VKYPQISGFDNDSDGLDNRLVLPKTTSDIDISHWSINYNNPVKVYNVKGVIIGSFISQRKAAK
jgi:hypothetical protein